MENNFYQFSAKSLLGKEISMETYKGKTILVVNTASKCVFTPQYEGLQELYRKYRAKGFVILGFPCNQFADQEPDDEKIISDNCLTNYGVTFPMFAKIDVNGDHAHPIFEYLKRESSGLFSGMIKWNFTKFLVNSEGKPIKRFEPKTTPASIEKDIEGILN